MIGFVSTFWKPLAIVAVIVAGWLTFNHLMDRAYKAGESASEARHRAELDRVNEINREREKALSDDLRAFGERFAALSEERRQKEQVIVTKLDDRIAAQPDCEIDPEIVKLRNDLRAVQ